MKPSSIAIVGAGCAGLTLARLMVECAVPFERLVLIDPRASFERDRTWCFWRTFDHSLPLAETHEWTRWRVRAGQHSVDHTCRTYPYVHVASTMFYERSLATLARDPRVELLLSCSVEHIWDVGSAVRIGISSGRDLVVDHVFDSRPPTLPSADDGEIALLQHFHGWHVRTPRPAFERGIATLMDFHEAGRDDAVHFFYVLPYAPDEALVETTYFSDAPLDVATYEADLRRYLDERYGLSPNDVSVLHTEHGVIPMTTAPWVPGASRNVTRIGVAAGCAKPSTGYAYGAIQTHSLAIANALAKGGPVPTRPVRPAGASMLDRVFLGYLDEHRREAPELFRSLFSSVPAEPLVRFLTDRGNALDDLAVMRALPSLPFATQALRALRLFPSR